MEHADESYRLSRLDPPGDDVLDLEVDRVPILTLWRSPSSTT